MIKFATIFMSLSLIFSLNNITSSEDLDTLIEDVLDNTHKNNASFYGFSFYKSDSVQIITQVKNEIVLGISGNNVYMNITTSGMEDEMERVSNEERDMYDYFYQGPKIIIEVSRTSKISFIKVINNNSSLVAEVPLNDEAFVLAEMTRILSSVKVSQLVNKEDLASSDAREIVVNNSKQDYFNSIDVKSFNTLNIGSLAVMTENKLFEIMHEKAPTAKKR